jgi:hypothetical protein
VNFSHREIHARELMRTSLSAESICAKRDFPATHPDTLHPMKGRRNRCAKISLAVLALPNKAPLMPNRSEAEEHLRIIRSLMEKATIYRAISAPTALIGGLCSIVFGLSLHSYWRSLPRSTVLDGETGSWLFMCGWLGVLAVTCAANTWFLWRDARRRGEPFISAGMKQALKCLAPPMLVGGFVTFLLRERTPFFLPLVWMIFYSLALLATAPFAPRSIPRLGWVFLLAGFVAFFLRGETAVVTDPNLLMAATFGGFHLIYAAFTWPRTASQSDSGVTP